MKISFIIPAYNEADNLPLLFQELNKIISTLSNVTDYEIIVIDDYSEDNTFQTISELSDPKIICKRLNKRSGSHTAIRAGLRYAKGDIVLCISADGQDNPEILQQMINKVFWDKNNVVWAVRNDRNENIMYKVFTFIFYKILSYTANIKNLGFDFSKADFYLLDRKIVDAVNSCNERNTSLFGLILWLGFKQSFVTYNRRQRFSGKSKWNFFSLAHLAKDWIIAFSGIPLKLITYIGMLFSCLGFIYALIIFTLAIRGITIHGWAETTIIILIIGGIQMTMLGIIGEYVWRNLDESRKRPLYFIEKET